MKKLLSLALSAAVLATPVLGSAEAGFDTAFDALSTAKAVEAQLTAETDTAVLTAFGLDTTTAQAVKDLLDVSGLYGYVSDNSIYAEVFVNDTTIADLSIETEADRVCLQSDLLGSQVYSIDNARLAEILQSASGTAAAVSASESGTTGISQEQAQEIAQQIMSLDFNFDNTLAAVSALADKMETAELNGGSSTTLELTDEEVVSLLRTAAADLCATQGLADILSPYIPGLTSENLSSMLGSAIDSIAESIQGKKVALSFQAYEDSTGVTIAIMSSDGSAGFGLSASLSDVVTLGLYQIENGEANAIVSLQASAALEDDNAALTIVLTVLDQAYTLDLSALADGNTIEMKALAAEGETVMGSLDFQVQPYVEDPVDLIEDTADAIDLLSLSQADQEAMVNTAAANLQTLLTEEASQLPASVRTMLGL